MIRSRTIRKTYLLTAWMLMIMSALLLVSPHMVITLGDLSPGMNLRPLLLTAALLMMLLRRAGNFPKRSLAAWAPLVFAGIFASEYVLSATGCSFAGGLHPANAVGIMAVSLGLIRASGSLVEERN